MKTKTILQSFGKVGFALALSLLMFTNTSALTLKAEGSQETTAICEGFPVELKASDVEVGKRLMFQRKREGGVWENLQEASTVRPSFVDDDVKGTTIYRIQYYNNNTPLNEFSNEVVVTIRTEGCTPPCEETSTGGEYIFGTDFNQSGSNFSKIPDDVQHFFPRQNIIFNEYTTGYKLTTDVKNYLGKIPSKDTFKTRTQSDYKNSYLTFNGGNFYLCELKYIGNRPRYDYTNQRYYDEDALKFGPNKQKVNYRNAGTTYTFSTRLYIQNTQKSDNCWNGAKILSRTGHGTVTNDMLEVELYDDETGELLDRKTASVSGGVATINFSELYGEYNMSQQMHLMRMEISFYGNMPEGDNYDWYSFTPMFEQFCKSSKIAVDFISSAVQTVCMTKSAVCNDGTTVNVITAGFAKNAQFRWDKLDEDGKSWQSLTSYNGLKEVSIPVDFIGKRRYRVYDVSKTGDDRKYIEFDVVGKDCKPAAPESIPGGTFCLPTTGTLQIPIEVTPGLNKSDIRYGWSLTAPDGKTVYVNRNAGGDVVMDFLPSDAIIKNDELFYKTDAENWRVANIQIPASFVSSMPVGDSLEYTLTVQQYKDDGGWLRTGDPKTSILKFYRTPDATFAISQGADPSEPTKICPYVSPVSFTGNTTNNGGYKYEWSITSGGAFTTTDQKTANVSLPIECDVKTLAGVKLEVSVAAMPTCKASSVQNVSVSRGVPVITCPVGNDIVENLECPGLLTPVVLYNPEITNTCDPDPLVKLEFKGTYIDNGELKSYSQPSISKKKSQLTSDVLTQQFPVTSSLTKNGSIKVVYTAYDVCNQPSAPCELSVVIKDTKGPDIDCNERVGLKQILGNIVVNMSSFGNDVCDGVNVPVPTPVLTDKCDGSKISGVFFQRDDTKDITDKFSVGTTVITWRFFDNAGNYSECSQLVVVVDDRLPKLTCTTTGGDIEISTDASTCSTSPASALQQIIEQLGAAPSATNYCGATNTITQSMEWSSDGGTTWKAWSTATSFAKDQTYIVRWVFTRTYTDGNGDEKTSVAYCTQQFTVKDKVKPEVDCSNVQNIIANVNIKTRQRVYSNGGTVHTYTYKEDYASAVLPDGESDGVGDKVCKDDPEYCCKEKDPSCTSGKDGLVDVLHGITGVKEDGPGKWKYNSEPGYEFKFSLANKLVEANMPTAVDKCDGAITPVITITDKSGTVTSIAGLEELRKFKFMLEGSPYTIKYVFTDLAGNSDLCEQTVTTVRQGAPITNCWEDTTKLIAGETCQATTDVYSYANVPSATIKYNLVTVSGGSKEKVEEITKTIYPYKIERDFFEFTNQKTGDYDKANPTSHLEADNDSPLNPHKTTQYIAPAVGTDKSIYIYESKGTSAAWAEVLSTTFPLGVTKITLHYQNTSDKTDEAYESATCEAYVIVTDKTNPVVDCKSFQGTITKRISTNEDATDKCYFTWEQVGLIKPEVTQLGVTDNCSGNSDENAGNFSISGFRYYKGLDGTETGTEIKESAAGFKGNFPIGTTEIIWRVFDMAGNTDPNVCKQTVVVIDDVAPLCPELKDINVPAEEDKVGCYALSANVTKHPNYNASVKATDDNCSPTGGDILYYTVKRSDGLGLLDNYPVGTTQIIWSFKDNALVNNIVGCPQNVIVTDETGPKFECLSEDRTYYIETGCSFPSKNVNFGVPSPKDNCSSKTELTYTLSIQQMKSKTEAKPGAVTVEHIYNPVTMKYDPAIPDLVAGLHKMTWIIKDKVGNESDPCTFYVKVKDTIPPRPDCPEPKELNAPLNSCSAEANLNPDDYSYLDPCDKLLITPTWVRSDGETTLSAPFNVGDTYVTWTWQDTTGNAYSCKQKIHVKDVTPPVVKCTHQDKPVEIGTVDCQVSSDDLRKKLTSPTATDGCDGLTPTRTTEVYYKGLDGTSTPVKQVDAKGNAIPWTEVIYQTGHYTIDFIFTDTTGNSANCSIEVFVKDESQPDVECPSERVVKNPKPDECDFSFTSSLINPNEGKEHCLKTTVLPSAHLYDPVAKDYLDAVATFPIVVKSGDSVMVRWDYESKLSYVRSCYQKLVVVDNQWPADFCESLGLAQIDLVADENECKHTVAPGDIPVPSFEDNCGTISGELVSYIFISGEKPDTTLTDNAIPTSFKTGKTVLRWRFHDTAHEDTCEQTVFVKGSIEPDFDCKSVKDILVPVADCGPAENVEFTQPFAIDVCQPQEALKQIPGYLYLKDKSGKDSLKLKDNSFELGKTPVKWTFTEFTGNASKSCPFNVIVKTSKVMEPSCPKDVTTKLTGDVCFLDTTVKQLKTVVPCSGDVVNGVLYLNGNATPESDLSISLVPGPNTLKWFFTDYSGILIDSIAECSQVITIDDPRQPALPCSNEDIPDVVIDECSVPAYEIDFKNTGIDADEICPQGDQPTKVKPLIWVGDDKEHAVNKPSLLPPFEPGEYIIHWEYTFHPSGVGNYTNGCTQKLTVKTTKEIVIDCHDPEFAAIPKDANADCEVPADEVTFNAPNATNPCDATVSIAPQAYIGDKKITGNTFTEAFPLGTTTITWKYVDETGTLTNSVASCTQDVVVTDNTKPTVTCQEDITYYLGRDADGVQSECNATPANINLKRPTVQDNCTSADDFRFWLKRVLNGAEVDSLAPYEPGTTVVTWTVKDKAGNASTCTMNVIVLDTVSPKPVCPADMPDIQAPEGKCEAVIPAISPEAYKFKDKCDTEEIIPVGTRSDDKAISDPYPVGTTTITWVYTDSVNMLLPEADRSVFVCHQVISVADITKPVVDCSNTSTPINVETVVGECEVPADKIIDKITLPTATDKCQNDAPVMTSNRWYLGREGDSIPTRKLNTAGEDIKWDDDVPFKAGYYEIHFIFTDNYGNADSCSQKVFVKDMNPPYLNDCKEITDKVLNPKDGECDAAIVPTELNTYKGKEVCTGEDIEGVPSLLVKEGDEFVVSTNPIPATVTSGDSIYIRWTYTSQMGIPAVCDQMIKVVDNQKPVIKCDILTPPITLTADPEECSISAANANIQAPTVEDNCGTITGRPVRIDTLTNLPNGLTMEDPYPTGKSVIRWYFVDTNPENADSCDQTVFVKGSVKPEIDCDTITGVVLRDTIETCDIAEQTLKVNIPVAIDKCAPTEELKAVNGVGVRDDGKKISDLYPLGITTITWSFTDFTGNAVATCTQKVNIVTEQRLITDCADTVALYSLDADECLKDITLDQRTAKHPCPEAVAEEDRQINGVPYLDGAPTPLTSLNIKLAQGMHYVTWLFTDNTNTLATPIDTCYDSIKVGNDNVPPVPCVNDRIDTTLQDLCELPAAKVELKNTGVDAPQLCGDDGEMVVPEIWTAKHPTHVNDPADLPPFHTGVDTVFWKYDFNPGHQGIYTVWCKQVVDVKTDKGIDLACPDSADNVITVIAPHHACEVPGDTITLNPVVGKNPCIDTVFITGVPDRDTTLAWPIGITTITYTYTDTTKTLINNIATCKQYVNVKDTANPDIDCEALYTGINQILANCKISADELGLQGIDVTQCGFVMTPVPTRFSGKAFTDDYVAGNDTVYWTYTYQHNGLTTVCPQPVILRDTTPVFDCKDLNTITLTAPEEKCVIEKSLAEVLDALEPYPTAIDPCDAANPIPGVYKVAGVDTLPTQLTAGDTIHVVWSFADADRFADTAFCDQYVIIKGNVTPEINCEVAAPAIKDTIDDCGPDHELKLPIVKAYDPCFSDSIPGSFVRDDNEEELNAPFQLGHTNVTWTFWNVDSTKSKICEQDVHVYTRREIEKPCDTAAMPVVEVPAPEDACTVPADDVKLTPAFAISPCTRDTIWGVPTRFDGEAMTAPYKIGKTIIIWTFNDVTDNLVIQSDTCHQIVRVGSVEVEPVKCDSFPAIEKVLAAGNCTIDAAELGIKAPTIIDRCPNGAADAEPEYVKPIITRFSKPGWTSSEAVEIAEFGVGYDTLWWSYPRFSTVCAQPIHIMDSMAPKFECDDLKPILVETEKGKCDVNMADIITEPYPFATEYCIDSVIVGVPTLLNGDPLPTSLKAGDSIVVKWTFSALDYSVVDKICEQPVRVIGTAAPQFDCNTLDTLKFITDDCSLGLDETKIPTPVATDSCTGNPVPGKGVRLDGGNLYGVYPLGLTTIKWTFTSPDSKVSSSCEQVVQIKTTKEIRANCGDENFPPLSYEVKNGDCTVPAANVGITQHIAYYPCNTDIQIDGVPTRSDNKDMDAPYELGVTTITWTFTDTTNTLVNPVSSCTQTVTVTNSNTPEVDCPTAFPAVRVSLDAEDCNLDFSKIPVYLNPVPANPCSDEIALVDTTRKSGKGVKEPYEVGVDTIVWKLWFASNNLPVYCEQRVEVVDTIAPAFDCSVLADTIVVEIKTAGNTVTYQEVEARGFYIPVVTDKCGEVFTEVTRDDNKDLTEDFSLGNTIVTFRFTDEHNNDTVCSQVVKVVDMIPPKVKCPTLENTIACTSDTTAAYATYEEFVAAGGSVDPVEKANLFTFRHEDKFEGDSCSAVITREYYLTSINEVDVHCETAQHFYVKDSIAPYYIGIPAGGASKVTTCDKNEIEPPVVTAADNCDPEPSLKMFTTSTQGDDPSRCDYYTYDVIYTWVASDRCGNEADSVKYIVHVKDTVAPSIELPSNWDVPEYPLFLKKCRFGVPDLTALIDTNWISQNCGNNEYLTFSQSPAAGTEITQTTVVQLFISDVCGNTTVIEKTVKVKEREEIISITPSIDPVVCGGDGTLDTMRSAVNSLADRYIRKAEGYTWIVDWDGSWVETPTVIYWDYYRGKLDEDHLVFSNNPETYAHLFESVDYNALSTEEEKKAADLAYAKYLMLLRQHQSDTYIFVAQDTVSGCTDTASIDIHVHEVPRLQLESGEWNLCEGDSLALRGEFGSMFPVCVNDMGGAILDQGWLINDSIYKNNDPVLYDDGIKHTAIYYATNHCGTTTTFNSLYTSCSGDLETHKDSLAVAGSEENMKLFKEDKLVLRDSVKLNVYTHYDPTQVLLTTYPQVKPRVWTGEDADLILTLPYKPVYLSWRRVEGDFDARTGAIFDRDGYIIGGGSGENNDADLFQELWNSRDTTIADSVYLDKRGFKTFRYTIAPSDTSYYYAVVGNGVCPAVASNMVNVDVIKELPTAITPYTKDGMNDDFMRGHHVVIFNRYGQMIYESNDGWDGTYRGLLADPGVYFYSCDMKNGVTYKGSVEVVKIE